MNCKPGDLAIVVQADWKPAIGLIVKVIEKVGMTDGVFEWYVEPPRATGCWSLSGEEIVCNIIRCPDAWLRPVSGIPVTDDVHDEVTA